MELESKPIRVTHWAKSTENKVTTFLDDYLINYPVKSVRESTRNLLNSLYKKGTPAQKQNLLSLIKERIPKMSTIGNSSSEFLTLIYMIFQGEVENKTVEKKQILDMILQQCQEILKNATENDKYDFYCYLSNTLDFSIPLRPHLIEASGCLKCYGKTEFVFEQKEYKEILREIKAHISEIELVFKKTYAVKDLKINLTKKKIVYKSVSVFYIDEKGEKKQLGGKYGPQETLPTLEFNGKGLVFEFDHQRSKRHLMCHVCGNANMPEEYSYICSMCFQKCVDIDGSFKVIGADPQLLSDELCSKYMELECQKEELELVYDDIKNNRKAQFPNYSMIKEMEETYGQIMKNLQLLKNDDSQKFNLKECKYCFSCNIIEVENIIDYFKRIFDVNREAGYELFRSFTTEEIALLIEKFIEFSQINKLNHLEKKIISILSNLILLKNQCSINYVEELKKVESPKIACEILYNIIRLVKIKENNLKENETSTFDWNELSSYLNKNNYINQWSIKDKIKLFSTYFVKSELIEGIEKDGEDFQKESYNDLDRVDIKEFKKFSNLLNFDIADILKLTATTHNKLFLLLLPETLIPNYNFDIIDAEYLKYIKTEVPVINDELIYSNIVYSPQPIIKLNLFATLPNLVTSLSLDDSMKLITCLVKYKNLWNMNIKKAFKQFEQKLNEESDEKKLLLSLEGYEISKEEMYLNKIYEILVPQRTKIIIRMEVPEADMQREERSRDGGLVQYPYLPVREVKTEDLNGDTMRALCEWVTNELKKINQYMTFDLIVDKYIIDNLDLPIEVVYKKIAQKEMKKKIGLQQYDFMRVIYRIQGLFEHTTESASSNPRDEKIETCLSYSSYLLTRIPAINKTGLDVIMEILSKLKKSEERSYREKLFKILHIISMKPEIIKKIIECQYADLIINFTSRFFSLDENRIKFSEVMLDICSKIIKEANEEMINLRKKSFNEGAGLRKESELMDIENTDEGSTSESEKAVKYLLEKVKQCDEKDRKDLAEKIITIIPFLSKDEYGASKYLYDYFELGQTKVIDLKSNKKLNWFLQFIDTLAESYTSFKIVCRENNLTDELVSIIAQYIEHFKTLEEKKNIKNLDILELSLSIIKGLIRGDEVLQKSLFDKNIIQELEKISKLSEKEMQAKNIKVGKVLTISYEIIKYFKEGRIVHPEISDFIKGEHAEKMKRNLEKKKARLEAMKKKNAMIAQTFENQIMINEHEDILVCPICREGENKKNDVLGVYIYSFKTEINAIEGWWKENKRQPGLTSVSYFTPIHYECHMNACATDQKNQKSEWEGALVRNSEVKLNGWIAIKGSKTTDEEYDKVNKKYFDKNSKVTGFWIVLNDLNGLLEKFATEYNFSQETKGSSSLHNCKLILALISTACHYMKKAGEELKLLYQGIKYIEEHMTKRGHLLYLFFCVSMFTNHFNDYQEKKEKYLRMIDHLELTEFKEKKKFYIYLALINEINCLIHVTLKEDKKLFEYMDRFIPENFATLIGAFEKIAEKYKNVFKNWDNESQVKEYFAVSSN